MNTRTNRNPKAGGENFILRIGSCIMHHTYHGSMMGFNATGTSLYISIYPDLASRDPQPPCRQSASPVVAAAELQCCPFGRLACRQVSVCLLGRDRWVGMKRRTNE
eukprot:GHVU01113122.1.p2 GENE.GHVU01113122.1~~GHVU01113122.1.p2  ORF type:complete len:106 (+),score=4.91 GHVU01113122.1:594-911(+)